MNYRPILNAMIVRLFVFGCLTLSVPAAEIITVEDFEQKIVTKEHLTKTADNVIILFDASVSMNETYSGKSFGTYGAK
jgi:hypothetical protein